MKKICLLALPLMLAACQTLPTSQEYLARGDGYFKDGNASAALKAYNHGLRLNPDNTAIYAARGAVYFFQGDYAQAQADFVKVLDVNPYQVDAYSALGSTLAAQGDYETALEILNLALQLDFNKPEIFFSRGGVNLMLGNYEQAVFDYTHVINLRPAADVYNARGTAYLRWGKNDLAQKDFETAKTQAMPATLNEYTMVD